METATLDDLMALNDQLAALEGAGVPVVVGSAGTDLARTLASVNSAVARRVSRGESLESALEEEESIPAWYRCLVLCGLRSGDVDSALAASNRVAKSVDDARDTLISAFFYPLIVCGVAYLGMIMFSLVFVPTLEQTYDDLRIEPGRGLTVLSAVRDALPYWVAIPPLALLIFTIWRYRRRAGRAAWDGVGGRALMRLAGASRSVTQARWASLAESLASLEAAGVPLAEALPLAACACGDSQIAEAGRALAASLADGSAAGAEGPAARRFPPFLRWAILQSESSTGRVRALETAAAAYREAADERAARARVLAPMLVCVILGGGVTLLYGLALFVPVVEMLRAIAMP
jgi:type II secretory pathway component PulF